VVGTRRPGPMDVSADALHIHSVDNARAADGLVPRPRVVVVGVGHGGLECVQALKREPVDVLVVDRHNYHTFQPLLYQVATAGLDVDDVTQAARHIFQNQANVDFRLGTVVGVDFEARLLLLDEGRPVPYDVLVLAAGATTAYFGVEGAESWAFPLKSAREAVDLRSHILRQFEAANRNPALVDEGATTVVVVGGGATGVETAGALHELFQRVLARDFPGLDVDARARVVIVEGGDFVMDAYKEELRVYTRRQLEKRGIDVRLNVHVSRVTADGVGLDDGSFVPARTTVWAAGVRAVPLAQALGVETTRGGRVLVDDALRVPGHPEVFVVGDMAGASDASGALYPQVAQVAIQQGRHAARQMRAIAAGHAPRPFRYRDPGMMATIGRNAAILQLPNGFTMRGFLAWVGWLLVHVLALAGFRNRVAVLFSWVYNYFTFDRGPRTILAPERPAPVPSPTP
jgi:NADH dehydrogenase